MTKASSVHVTFAREAEWKFLAAQGFLQRNDQQFALWYNQGYGCFEDFLGSLNSRHRKAIRRERRRALADGITIHALTGNDISEDAWDAFFAFYMETGSREMGARPLLTRGFFSLIGESMAEDVALIMATGATVAGSPAPSISSAPIRCSAATGGAIEHHPFLPFRGLLLPGHRFCCDPARPENRQKQARKAKHKIARGYLPQTTYSAHYIARPRSAPRDIGVSSAERAYVAEAGRELSEGRTTFRKTAE